MNEITVFEASKILKKKNNILILTHRNPDGDTLGCGFALLRALKKLGKTVDLLCPDIIPKKYSYMWQDMGYDPETVRSFKADFVVAVDIASPQLLGNLSEEFKSVDMCIDHHITNTKYAERVLLQPTAAACEIVFDVVSALGVFIDKKIADCLYTGISTDTGCFRYGNTTPQTHIKSAELIKLGADYETINRIMFETKTLSYLKLEQKALEGMEMYYDNKCALIVITQQMLKDTGTDESDCDGITVLSRKIEGVLCGITLRQRTDMTYKCSLRSYSPINASEICKTFGGGGHVLAAGCEFLYNIDIAKARILEAVKKEFAEKLK